MVNKFGLIPLFFISFKNCIQEKKILQLNKVQTSTELSYKKNLININLAAEW